MKDNNGLALKLQSGAIAGVIGTLIIYPMDIVKTTLQNSKSNQYSGVFDCFRQIVRKDGPRGLYKGLSPNLIGIIPEKAIKLAVNDFMREYLNNGNNSRNNSNKSCDELPIHLGMIAGATAGFCQVVATNPMEIIKIRIQVASLRGETVSMMKVISELGGIRGIYKGTTATLMRDVPFSFVFFPLLAAMKTFYSDLDKRFFIKSSKMGDKARFWTVFAGGITAGVVAASIVTPMDVVKTRLQVKSKPGDPVYTGMLDCYKQIIKNEGPKALFKGVIPRTLIVAPLFAITVLVYELQQRFFSFPDISIKSV